jgi:hypothetical protein
VTDLSTDWIADEAPLVEPYVSVAGATATPRARTQLILPHPIEPRDQGDVPCCFSIAIVTCMELIQAQTQRGKPAELSPLFHYYETLPNKLRPSLLEVRAALQTAIQEGVCRLALHRPLFTRAGALQPPASVALADAGNQRIRLLEQRTAPFEQRVAAGADTTSEWKAALRSGSPLFVGFQATPGYWKMLDRHEPTHPVDTPRVAPVGHGIVVHGWDDARASFIVKDSRGLRFGPRGRWYLPYTLVDTSVVEEAWAIERISYD